LLHGPGKEGDPGHASLLFRLSGKGPRVYSREELLDSGYPSSPSTSFYIVYELLEGVDEEVRGKVWDIRSLSGYQNGGDTGEPFIVSLKELEEVESSKKTDL